MILNLDKQFLNLDGNPFVEKMDDTLAYELAFSTRGNPVKMIEWAKKLVDVGEIELNIDELLYLYDFVKHSINLSNLAKSQLIDEFDKLYMYLRSR